MSVDWYFKVHKFVLLAHSNVFRAMFSQKEFSESVQSRMKITDFDSDVAGQMLMYLYTGELPEELLIENLAKLLRIAEKYQLELLKLESEDKLIHRFIHY